MTKGLALFGIGGFELFLILLFGFLIFGPDKLPEMAKTLGKALAKFRSAQDEMNKVIKTEVYDPGSDEPFKNPLDILTQVGESAKKLDSDDDVTEKTETFSERKARYDRERAAKKAAEEAAAAEAESENSVAAVGAAAGAVKAATDASEKSEEASKPVTETKPRPTADELYGTKPLAKDVEQSTDATEPADTTEKGE